MKTAIRDKIFETSGVGQAPSKDFFHLTVTRESIIWRSWRITLRSNKSLPGETTHSWDEFVNNSKGTRLQGEIRRVFGVETLNIVLAMVTQTWLPYLKSDILTEILVRLDLRDIIRLAQVRYLKLLWWPWNKVSYQPRPTWDKQTCSQYWYDRNNLCKI